ncbi:MAG: DUF1573 domain-containing protein [Bacteroidetes bacterium]|nr:MAG: DUF1573 domain-containing protein [Bacteroidota bacterium]
MKENLKIGLLAIIAVTLIINTVLQIKDEESDSTTNTTRVETVKSTEMTPPTQPQITKVENPSASDYPPTSIEFEEYEYDFGTVKQDSKNTHIFKFKNTGDNPLIISNARGSCGCTVPTYPKEPIPPGGTGEIEVVYSPGKQKGLQNKTVTIFANTDPQTTLLKISANVEENQ